MREATLCIVLASLADEGRLLYVLRSARFPRKTHDENSWRVIAQGVEAPDEAKSQLSRHGFFESQTSA